MIYNTFQISFEKTNELKASRQLLTEFEILLLNVDAACRCRMPMPMPHADANADAAMPMPLFTNGPRKTLNQRKDHSQISYEESAKWL